MVVINDAVKNIELFPSDFWRKSCEWEDSSVPESVASVDEMYDYYLRLTETLSYLQTTNVHLYKQSLINAAYWSLEERNHVINILFKYNTIGIVSSNGRWWLCSHDDFESLVRGFIQRLEIPETCHYCGDFSNELEEVVGGYRICSSCIVDSGFVRCDCCGKLSHPHDVCDIYNIDTGKTIFMCYNCRYSNDVHTIYCPHHNRVEFHNSEESFVLVGDSYYCRDAVADKIASGQTIHTCQLCEGATFNIVRKRDANNKLIKVCPLCASRIHKERFIGGMRGYSYKPTPIFTSVNNRTFIDNGDDIFMGVELEWDGLDYSSMKDTVCEKIHNLTGNNLCYCKSDGSLDCGIEMVSYPMTYEFAQTMDWGSVFDCASTYDLYDAKTAGFHIHVNRKSLGKNKLERDLCEARIVAFFDRFYDRLVKVARREEREAREWACMNHGYFERDDSNEVIVSKKLDCENGSRYVAVNLTNTNTIEIRLWHSTINVDTFLATMFITKSIVELVKKISMEELFDLEWQDFMKFVEDNCEGQTDEPVKGRVTYLLNLGC